jgi:hypothetical protein
MKKLILAAFAALVLFTPVAADGHHVEVPSPERQEYVLFTQEFIAQITIISTALESYRAATSSYEKQDLGLLVETAFTTSIDHWASLGDRVLPCFRGFYDLALIDLVHAADTWATFRASGGDMTAPDWTKANASRQALIDWVTENDATVCMEETTRGSATASPRPGTLMPAQ